MRKYNITFTGECTVEANSEEEAKRLFDRHIDPSTGILNDKTFNIVTVIPQKTREEVLSEIANVLYEAWRYGR